MSFEKIIKRNDYYFCINYADITPSDLSFLKSCWEQQEFKQSRTINSNGSHGMKKRYLTEKQLQICRRIIRKCRGQLPKQMR